MLVGAPVRTSLVLGILMLTLQLRTLRFGFVSTARLVLGVRACLSYLPVCMAYCSKQLLVVIDDFKCGYPPAVVVSTPHSA